MKIDVKRRWRIACKTSEKSSIRLRRLVKKYLLSGKPYGPFQAAANSFRDCSILDSNSRRVGASFPREDSEPERKLRSGERE